MKGAQLTKEVFVEDIIISMRTALATHYVNCGESVY